MPHSACFDTFDLVANLRLVFVYALVLVVRDGRGKGLSVARAAVQSLSDARWHATGSTSSRAHVSIVIVQGSLKVYRRLYNASLHTHVEVADTATTCRCHRAGASTETMRVSAITRLSARLCISVRVEVP